MEYINENRTQKEIDLEQPVRVSEREYVFSRQALFDDAVSLMLPDNFVDLPEELAKEKYPMEARPQIIKTNGDTTINFSFNQLKHYIKQDEVAAVTEEFLMTIKHMQPANHYFDNRIEDMDKLRLGWFDYRSPTIDGEVYILMAFAPIKDFLLHAVFTCPAGHMEDWKPVALKVFCSLEVVAGKERRIIS